MNSRLFTSEPVTGHPDKLADQIRDGMLDAALLAQDPRSRVAVETLTTAADLKNTATA